MSLFVANQEEGSETYDPASRRDATVVHIDDTGGIVWAWVPGLHTAQEEISPAELFVWNTESQDKKTVQFVKLDLGFRYKGLARLVVRPETFAAQRPWLTGPDTNPADWPNTGGTLQEIVDAINLTAPLNETLQTLKAIALCATSPNASPESQPSLQIWLASTAAPTAIANLANPSVFADTMRHRPHLFAELARLVPEQRMVFLLGSKQSYLDEFLDGFQEYIETRCADDLAHVAARFNSEDFRQIHGQCSTLLPYSHLDCLLSSIAFAAANGLKQKAGKFLPDILTAQMLGRPVVFAQSYLRNATQHDDHWQCIRHFLVFLTNAAQAAGITGKITVFLPFDKVEEVINGNDDARRHLWEGLGALRQRLESQTEPCPQLGIVLAVQDLAIDRTTEALFVRRVLTIPPLSRAELGELLRRFWGSPADAQELNAIDEYSGGDPWFVFLLLRCLRSVTETRSQAGKLVRGEDTIIEACQLALKAIRGGDPSGSQRLAPADTQADCDVYLDECRLTLRQYHGQPGARVVLKAWEHPESYHAQRREIEKFERAWILTGLVYTQALRATRGDSLTSLHEYPRYQFCQAGKLPLAFAERVLTTAKRQPGSKS